MMPAPIHIEGMGWLGSLVALRMRQARKRFTWSDIDSPVCAWHASTGLVYPGGDARSLYEMALWTGWSRRNDLLSQAITPAAFVFAHKNPPHGGKYTMTEVFGTARRANAACFAMDVPTFVNSVRELIADYRTDPERGSAVIRAHGYGTRLGNLVWGWSAPAFLEFPDTLDKPVALYGKPHRYQTVYAVPRGDHHMIGSSSIPQGLHPRTEPDLIMRAIGRWTDAFQTLFPTIKITGIGVPTEGWRPKPVIGDDGRVRRERDGRTITLPPLYHSGVRWAPSILDETLRLAAQL